MKKYRINPGEYRHIITIQQKTKIQNDYGEEIEDWVDLVTTRAGIYPISGKEFFAAETVNSEVTHKVNMRYIPNKHISPDMRVKFGDRYFHIESVINFQEKNVELQLMCKELVK
ncbi:phage head closure protein [Aeribacillus composti]|uniref:Phage head closure protein n=1 Tax=Aeribacillus composti TaxID=1868734 RepID=A0ABY9W663_9BACI|nr:phage head closure protein [Aeribacillus composti]WNF31640.1 phage head closure protein [Aeribacillus composti]